MPSISDAIKAAAGLTNNIVEAAPVNHPTGAPSPDVYEPGRNSMIRCPLPTLWQDSTDSQRQFYLNGIVPQQRIFTPLPSSSGSSSTSATTGGSSSSSSSSFSGGSGSGGSTSLATSQASITTQILTAGQQFLTSLTVSKSFQLLSISAGNACRVQLYGTGSAQTQDAGRALDYPPPAGSAQNIITDVALDTAPYQWNFQNRAGANADSPQKDTLYLTVTNLGANSTAITLTFFYVALESA